MRCPPISYRNLIIFSVFLVVCAFGGIMANTSGKSAEQVPATTDQQSANSERQLPDPLRVELATSKGSIVLELDRDKAPLSVNNFLDYVASDFYTGTIFHRVIEGFMIQGGGFTADYQRKNTNPPVQNEANNGLENRKYTIAMARTSAPHSATAQFFINAADNDYLNFREATTRGWGYTVFGRVIEGKEIVDGIAQVETGAGGPFSRDAPKEQIVITAATLLYPEDASETQTAAENAGQETAASTEKSE